jgi:hypothetical protein
MIMARRDRRSARAPPSNPTIAVGRNPAAAIKPAQAAFPVSSWTYRPRATVSIHVPTFETNDAVHNVVNER